jgi:hypothetical protein
VPVLLVPLPQRPRAILCVNGRRRCGAVVLSTGRRQRHAVVTGGTQGGDSKAQGTEKLDARMQAEKVRVCLSVCACVSGLACHLVSAQLTLLLVCVCASLSFSVVRPLRPLLPLLPLLLRLLRRRRRRPRRARRASVRWQ